MANKKYWQTGDRVFGRFHGIPFIGSVALYHSNDPNRILIFNDLPIIHKGAKLTMLELHPKHIRSLTQF